MAEKGFDIAYATRELKGFGLDPVKVIPAWRESSVNSNAVDQNLKVLRILEREEKGSAMYLSDFFGIQNYGRYPAEVLLNQLNQRNNKTDPFVVWVNPLADRNGEFYKFPHQIGRFAETLPGAGLRIVEAGNPTMPQLLSSIKDRYAPIENAVIGGHGTANGIALSEDGEFNIDDLKKEPGLRLKEAFSSRPWIVLLSCSTGREGGFGQQLSTLTEGRVQAPKFDTSLEALKMINGRIEVAYVSDLSMRYRDYPLRADKAVYERGLLLSD